MTIILGVIAILFMTGVFTAGLPENEKMLENELIHISQEISKQYGDLSIQAIDFSKQLSNSIERKTEKLGISVSQLQEHPELLEEIISAELDRTLFVLQRSKSSGIFFILNATINPTLENTKYSRAGLYIKNMEPNIISSSCPNIITLRGSPSISRNNLLPLHTEWQMEFDVREAPYYHLPMQAPINNDIPLSRLYYWSPVLTLPNTSQEVMLCSVPLIDSQGNVFGVCGLEVSTMLFKLSHPPSTSIYNRLFCLLAPIEEDTIHLKKSMFSGGYAARLSSKYNDVLNITKNNKYFYSYKCNEDSYLGVHAPIYLYPKESVFYDEPWIVAVMVPEEDIVSSIIKLNILLIFSLMMLVCLGLIAAFILSKRFSKPITEGLDAIKSSDLSIIPKTNILEINDLIEYLASRNKELYERAKQSNLSFSMLDEFVEKTKTLSPAERSVFDLYVQGHTAKECAEKLCLSINTIKTHNKHIYAKLNVNSREELLLYIRMLEEIGVEL
ncbi:MAG: helix-turn-helix transcriptional regulator [Syntrophomonadaceae bacterium]|nr:helix-turn-helix transcriptional regulator [Syntrophomonadaceae bacterium]